MSPSLLAGVALGISVLLIFAFVLGQRATEKTWRGWSNAFGAGIVLGALVDLLPKALEFAGALVAVIMQTQVLAPLHAPPDGFLAIGAGILAEAVTPFGALLILFLYLSGNSVPMPVNGRTLGPANPGWRAWLSLPPAGRVDWKGIVIVTFGLGVHNLWLGQARGALAQATDHLLTTFFFAFGLIATLRAFALAGSLVDARAHWLALSVCALLIGGTGILGIANPETGRTIVLGMAPLFVAVLTLPVALGRLLRVMDHDIGLGWKTTLGVLAGLGLERLMGYLLLALVQAQLGLPQ